MNIYMSCLFLQTLSTQLDYCRFMLKLFKCSVEGNGLTLKQGARVSAGMGVQRTDEELTADITKQQSAYSAVKIIMQATGETTIEKMNRDAKTSFTSKTKQLIKSLTGNSVEEPEGPSTEGGNGGGPSTEG